MFNRLAKGFIVISLGCILGCGGLMQRTKTFFQSPFGEREVASEKVSEEPSKSHLETGKTLFQKGNIKGALKSFEAAVSAEPDSAEAHYSLALTYFELGMHSNAINEYKRTIQLKPDLAEAHFNLGVALDQSGQTENAIRSYRKAMSHGIDDAALHYNMGLSLLKFSRWEEAKKEFLSALEQEPNLAEAYNNIGYLDEAMDDLEGAIAMYKKALAVKPDYQLARENMERLVKAPPAVPVRPKISKREMMSKLFFEVDATWGFSRDVEIETSNATVEISALSKHGLFRLGYILNERIDVFLNLGLTDFGFEDSVPIKDVGLGIPYINYKRVLGFAYGAGVDAKIYYWDRMHLGFDAGLDLMFGSNEDEYKDASLKASTDWAEYTLRLQAKYLGFSNLVPYGGLSFSKLDGTLELDTGTQKEEQDYNEANPLGIFIGGSYFFGDHIRFQTEASFIDETALAFRIRYTF